MELMPVSSGMEQEHLLVDFLEYGLLDRGKSGRHPKVRVENLTKESDKGEIILKGVSVEIWGGQVVGIIGPSGSGKSTLLRALNRMWEPEPGSVFYEGNDILHLNVLRLRRNVGMLFQLPILFQGSVADNVRYGPELSGRKLTNEMVHRLLTMVDLDLSFANKNADELSVGQAQRVALARTLANNPQVLLLDEPTSALDPMSTEKIENAIMKLKSQGMTIVIVSHNIKQIERIGDVACLLVDGEIVEILKPSQLNQAQHPTARKFLQLSS